MKFLLSKPKGLAKALFNSEDETVGEALNSVYGNDDRYWTIGFGDAFIKLSLACIADVYADLVQIEKEIDLGKKFNASFLAPEITCKFEIEPKNNEIAIKFQWLDAPTKEKLIELKNLPATHVFDKQAFLHELTNFLDSTKEDLISAGYGYHFDIQHPRGIRLY